MPTRLQTSRQTQRPIVRTGGVSFADKRGYPPSGWPFPVLTDEPTNPGAGPVFPPPLPPNDDLVFAGTLNVVGEPTADSGDLWFAFPDLEIGKDADPGGALNGLTAGDRIYIASGLGDNLLTLTAVGSDEGNYYAFICDTEDPTGVLDDLVDVWIEPA